MTSSNAPYEAFPEGWWSRTNTFTPRICGTNYLKRLCSTGQGQLCTDNHPFPTDSHSYIAQKGAAVSIGNGPIDLEMGRGQRKGGGRCTFSHKTSEGAGEPTESLL